jgi:hypothetical protein
MELIRGCMSRRESARKVATALGVSLATAYRYISHALKEFGQEYALADAEIKEIVVTDCLETLCNPDAGPKTKEKARADLIRIWATTARRVTLVNPDGTSLQNLSDDELQAVEQQLGLDSAPTGPDQSPTPPTAIPDSPG